MIPIVCASGVQHFADLAQQCLALVRLADQVQALLLDEVGMHGVLAVTADEQLLDFDINQRATFRWVAAPGGELVIPAIAASTIFFNASESSGGYTGIARCTVHWEE